MTKTEALSILNSLPRPTTRVDFQFHGYNGECQHGSATVVRRADGGVHVVGGFGCGKPRDDVRSALIEYLSGRGLICHQHHN
jgi:hypothetical protein